MRAEEHGRFTRKWVAVDIGTNAPEHGLETLLEAAECGLETPHEAAESKVKERDSHLHNWGRREEEGWGELGPGR